MMISEQRLYVASVYTMNVYMAMCMVAVIISCVGVGRTASRPTDELVVRGDMDTDSPMEIPLALQRIKRSKYSIDPDWARALDYYKKLHIESSCKLPQPRVIPVQNIHPNSRLMYVTTCVVLHRCAHDTGCCHETEVCVPKDEEIITIPIITTNAKRQYELLTFTNHTMCQCLPKNKDTNSLS